jgi:hypothetical protein
MAEGSTPELRIRAVVDASGARSTLAELQAEANRGITVRPGIGSIGGTFAGEVGRTTASGLAAPIPTSSIATGIFQSPQPALPLEPPSMRMLQVAAFQERISNQQPFGNAGAVPTGLGTPMEAVAPTIGGGGSAFGGTRGIFAGLMVLHLARGVAEMRSGVERAEEGMASAGTTAEFYRAQAGRYRALQSGLLGGTFSMVNDLVDPSTSPQTYEARSEGLARRAADADQDYRLLMERAAERDVLAAGRTGYVHDRGIATRVAGIRTQGHVRAESLIDRAEQLDNVRQAMLDRPGGFAGLSGEQKDAVRHNFERSEMLRGLVPGIRDDTEELIRRTQEDDQLKQGIAAQGLRRGIAESRLRAAGRPAAAHVLAAWNRGNAAISEAYLSGDADVRQLAPEAAAAGTVEAVGDVVRAGAAGIAQWVRQRTAQGVAARRDVMHTAELQAQQGVAELRAGGRPVAATVLGILSETKLAVGALKTDDPEYTKQRDALRGLGVARLRAYQNSLADAGQAVEVAPGTIAPGVGSGRYGSGTEDVGKQVANAIKEAMGTGGNATGDAAGGLIGEIRRNTEAVERFISTVLGG